MPKTYLQKLTIRRGGRSREAMTYLAQLDDLTLVLLKEDLKGITAAELAWQPAPGCNTIGMLLAHLAIVETYWLQIAVENRPKGQTEKVIPLGMDGDGMPLPSNGRPPASLKGRTLRWYEGILKTSRDFVRRGASRLSDADLSKSFTRRAAGGQQAIIETRWVLHHLVEHFAAHQGQINLVRHLYRDRKRK